MKGKEKVNTVAGGILTAVIITLVLSYFVVRFRGLIAGFDPTINYNSVNSYYGPEQGLNLFEANHRFAISVLGASDGKTKYDSRYVRLFASYFYTGESGEDIYETLTLSQCT